MDFSLIIKPLVSSSIVAGLLAITIFIAKGVFKKKISAKWHYIIWFALLLRLAVPYVMNSPLNIWNFYNNLSIVSSSHETDKPMINDHNAQKASVSENSLKSLVNSINRLRVNYSLLFIIWLAGAAVLSLYYFLYNIFFWTKVKNGTVFIDNDIIKLLEECKVKLGVKTNVSIIQTSGVNIPAIFGVTRPWLLLPEEVLKNLRHESLRYVILHELAHLKRKDIIVNWIALVLQVIHWFNPIIWLAFFRMRADRELACDEAVLKNLDSSEGKKYGYTIIDMVEIISGKLNYAGAAGILENKSQIKDRISMISRFGSKKTKYPAFAAILFIILACSVFVNASNLEVHHSTETDKRALPVKASVSSEKNKADNSNKVVSPKQKAAITDQSVNNKKTAPVIVQNENSVSKITAPETKHEPAINKNKSNKTTTNEKKPGIGNQSDVTEEVPFDEENEESTKIDGKSAEDTAEQTSESGFDGTYLK